jgi:transketolase
MANASHDGADNLIAIVDVNRLGQRGPTMLEWDLDTYSARALAFGWHPIVVDGHDVAAIDAAFVEAEQADRPAIVIAKTEKGHGVSFLANREGWHGKALSQEEAERAIAELGGPRDLSVTPRKPEAGVAPPADAPNVTLPAYTEAIATRKAFGETLAALSARPEVVAIDGEVANSTYTEDLQKVAPDRFVEGYIAEQNMLGMAVGMQVLGKIVFPATFAAFFTRAYDFIRMAAISRADLRLSGSHAGVSIGEDGPSQMALEDIAMMRAVHGSTVLYPCDGNSTVALVAAMADLPGISYIRTTREKTPPVYGAGETFPVGGSKTLRSSETDRVTLVGAGITVHEALGAAEALAADGIAARVLDCYSIKPIDAEALRTASSETGLVVTIEDHWVEGGLGDAVLAALAADGILSGKVIKIAVTQMPGSGTPEELRGWAGISADAIAGTVRSLLR